MNVKMKVIGLFVLALSIFITGDLWAGTGAKRVEVMGDRMSVQVKGVPLGELLILVEDLTGVHFGFDELIAKRETFVDFEDLSVSEGIRKIIFPLSCAMIYDEMGKLRKVVILGRGKDSGAREGREVEERASEGGQFGSLHPAPFTPHGGSDLSTKSTAHPSRRGPVQFPEPPADNKNAEDGPPVNEPYSSGGPPDAQNGELTGPPNPGSTDAPTAPDSKDSQVDGPPLDRPYLVDGPPGWKK